MEVVILAGGLGTRLIEETDIKPKPMVCIGEIPILIHIMNIYDKHGYYNFVICLGYKGDYIKNYFKLNSNQLKDRWKISLVDTGLESQTSRRILKIKDYIKGNNFHLTYGDGVSDLNLNELVNFHLSNNCIFTLTAIQPEPRFGVLEINDKGLVDKFEEKSKKDVSWINGGFFICNIKIFDYIVEDKNEPWETGPLKRMSISKKLMAFKHSGFWKSMDSLKDKIELNKIYNENAPWI